MEVKILATKARIYDAQILERASELMRKAKIKGATIASGTTGLSLPGACLVLACREFSTPCNPQEIAKISGVPARAFLKALTTIENTLQISQRLPSLQHLAIQLGVTHVIDFAQDCFKKYKERYLKTLPEQLKLSAQLERPVFAVAIISLCCKKDQHPIDRVLALSLSGAKGTELARITTEIQALVPELVPTHPASTPITKKRRRLEGADITQNTSKEDCVINRSNNPLQRTPRTTMRKYEMTTPDCKAAGTDSISDEDKLAVRSRLSGILATPRPSGHRTKDSPSPTPSVFDAEPPISYGERSETHSVDSTGNRKSDGMSDEYKAWRRNITENKGSTSHNDCSSIADNISVHGEGMQITKSVSPSSADIAPNDRGNSLQEMRDKLRAMLERQKHNRASYSPLAT